MTFVTLRLGVGEQRLQCFCVFVGERAKQQPVLFGTGKQVGFFTGNSNQFGQILADKSGNRVLGFIHGAFVNKKVGSGQQSAKRINCHIQISFCNDYEKLLN